MLTRVILAYLAFVIIVDASNCFADTQEKMSEFQAFLKISQEDYKGAVEMYSKILMKAPTSENAYRLRSYAYCQLKMFDKALEDANSAIIIAPKNYENHKIRAYIHQMSGRAVEAIKDYTNALALCPKEEFSLSLGSDGIDFRRNADRAKILYCRARSYLKNAQNEKAKLDLELAIKLDPKNKESKRLLNSILEGKREKKR